MGGFNLEMTHAITSATTPSSSSCKDDKLTTEETSKRQQEEEESKSQQQQTNSNRRGNNNNSTMNQKDHLHGAVVRMKRRKSVMTSTSIHLAVDIHNEGILILSRSAAGED